MLDEGVRAGFDLLGLDYRCVGYVERDAYAASALVARMASAALDQAPIWDDIATFDGGRWRGVVDCVVAGFPCQDISVAGSRAGLDGKRSGLFYEVVRVAADCGARFIFLENVAGIVSADAAVVDQTEGELSERAAARVVGELADRGWDAEWLHLRASDVGAAHKRERWFCLAWRMADAELPERWAQRAGGDRQREGDDGERQADGGVGVAGSFLGHTDSEQPGRRSAPQSVEAGFHAHAQQAGARQRECGGDAIGRLEFGGDDVADAGLQHGELQQRDVRDESSAGDESLADAARLPSGQRTGRERVLANGSPMDDTEGERRRCAVAEHGEQIFAPGPGDIDGWNRVIADGEFDYRAPAIKPGVCRVVDGLAYRVDQHRADRLRCGGNGVVAAQAAAALVELVRRMSA